MPEIKIVASEDKKPEEIERSTVEKTIQAADDLVRMREANDALEKEITRKEELMQRAKMGGKADAGSVEKPQETTDKDEASKILSTFR